MSCDWRIWCLDCEKEHYFCDADHRVDLMRELVAAAPKIADLYKSGLFSSEDVTMRTSYGEIDPAWFAAHAGHRLVPRNEYGRCDDECGERIVCGECDTEHHCRLPPEHDGKCSRKRPATVHS